MNDSFVTASFAGRWGLSMQLLSVGQQRGIVSLYGQDLTCSHTQAAHLIDEATTEVRSKWDGC